MRASLSPCADRRPDTARGCGPVFRHCHRSSGRRRLRLDDGARQAAVGRRPRRWPCTTPPAVGGSWARGDGATVVGTAGPGHPRPTAGFAAGPTPPRICRHYVPTAAPVTIRSSRTAPTPRGGHERLRVTRSRAWRCMVVFLFRARNLQKYQSHPARLAACTGKALGTPASRPSLARAKLCP